MDFPVMSAEKYQEAIRKLFPGGDYWDKQFSDAQSDCGIFTEAKSASVRYIRERMSNLLDESFIPTASETIEDWERNLSGGTTVNLTPEQRRQLLVSEKQESISQSSIMRIAETYGITITNIIFPFRAALFGHTHFGRDRIASPAAFSTLFIYAQTDADNTVKTAFEKSLSNHVLANYIIYFFYGEN